MLNLGDRSGTLLLIMMENFRFEALQQLTADGDIWVIIRCYHNFFLEYTTYHIIVNWVCLTYAILHILKQLKIVSFLPTVELQLIESASFFQLNYIFWTLMSLFFIITLKTFFFDCSPIYGLRIWEIHSSICKL